MASESLTYAALTGAQMPTKSQPVLVVMLSPSGVMHQGPPPEKQTKRLAAVIRSPALVTDAASSEPATIPSSDVPWVNSVAALFR